MTSREPAPPELTPNFEIHWPPEIPTTAAEAKSGQPLLLGQLTVTATDEPQLVDLQIQLERPKGDGARQFWNERLAFPEYSWMASVRVWDEDRRWLWPNLAFLLTAHGRERVDRYGGRDPGKHVDNDFAAILIRPILDDHSHSSKDLLVSAQWYPTGKSRVGRRSVVHRAHSDRFQLKIRPENETRVGVWIIYADFLDAKPPRSWPQEEEFDGGILAYLRTSVQIRSDGQLQFDVEQTTPPSSCQFDWKGWSTGKPRMPKSLLLSPSDSQAE